MQASLNEEIVIFGVVYNRFVVASSKDRNPTQEGVVEWYQKMFESHLLDWNDYAANRDSYYLVGPVSDFEYYHCICVVRGRHRKELMLWFMNQKIKIYLFYF